MGVFHKDAWMMVGVSHKDAQVLLGVSHKDTWVLLGGHSSWKCIPVNENSQTLVTVKCNNAIMSHKSSIVPVVPPFYLIIPGINPSGNNAYFVMKFQPKTLALIQGGNFGKDSSIKLWYVSSQVHKMKN